MILITMSVASVAFMGSGWAEADIPQAPITPQMLEETAAPVAEPEALPEEAAYFDVPLAHEIQDAIFQASDQWNVPAALILAIIDRETDYRTDLVSSTGDYGLMQINAINHDWLESELGISDFMDPEQSIRCGAYMIGQLIEKYDGDLHHALTAYNRGEGGARTHYKKTGTYETSYSTSVLATFEALNTEAEGRVQNAG